MTHNYEGASIIMSNHHHSRVLIIGSGPAGYTAAIYAARASLQPMLVTGMEPGGQMSITTDVENYPGFADVIQGPWLMDQMRDQAAAVGTKMINDLIVDVDLARRPFRCVGDSGDIYTGDVVIIATGAQARWQRTATPRPCGPPRHTTASGSHARGRGRGSSPSLPAAGAVSRRR